MPGSLAISAKNSNCAHWRGALRPRSSGWTIWLSRGAGTVAHGRKTTPSLRTQEPTVEHDAVLVALQILEKVEAALEEKKGAVPAGPRGAARLLQGLRRPLPPTARKRTSSSPNWRARVKREGGPIGVMLMEHDAGRYVRAMSEGLTGFNVATPLRSPPSGKKRGANRDLLRRVHPQGEQRPLPMADRLVPDDAAVRIAEQFEAIERDRRASGGRHAKAYHANAAHPEGFWDGVISTEESEPARMVFTPSCAGRVFQTGQPQRRPRHMVLPRRLHMLGLGVIAKFRPAPRQGVHRGGPANYQRKRTSRS